MLFKSRKNTVTTFWHFKFISLIKGVELTKNYFYSLFKQCICYNGDFSHIMNCKCWSSFGVGPIYFSWKISSNSLGKPWHVSWIHIPIILQNFQFHILFLNHACSIMMVGYQTPSFTFPWTKAIFKRARAIIKWSLKNIWDCSTFGLLCSAIGPETHATISTNQTQN